jgi:4-amino-4-deoxy-L-arabinose transferase-like glycosyltransferase
MAFAFVVVILNIVKFYVINTEGDRKEAHMYVLYSVIGFFIILSFWGVVNIVINTFNLDSSAPSSWSQVQNIFPGSNSYRPAGQNPTPGQNTNTGDSYPAGGQISPSSNVPTGGQISPGSNSSVSGQKSP